MALRGSWCHALFISLACLIIGGPRVAGIRAGPGLSQMLAHEASSHAAANAHAWAGAEKMSATVAHGHVAWVAHLEGSHGTDLGAVLAYVGSTLGTIGAVLVLYWNRSSLEIGSIVVYLLALTHVRLAVKAVFVEYSFNFPLLVSAVHFAVCMVSTFAVLFHRMVRNGMPVPVPTWREFGLTILPIAASFAFCIGVGNKVLALCSVALSEILTAIQPMMSIPVVLMLGMPFDMILLLPTCLVVVSCVLCSLGDVQFSKLGLFLAMLSNVLRALKAALQQKMLTGEQKDKFDPCALLAWMSIPSMVLILAWSAIAEGTAPYARLWNDVENRLMIVVSVLISSVAACILNLSQLFVVGGLGAVGSQIVAQLKTVLTIVGGVALLSEKVTYLQCAGFTGVVVGIFVYSRMETAAKQAAAKKGLPEADIQRQLSS